MVDPIEQAFSQVSDGLSFVITDLSTCIFALISILLILLGLQLVGRLLLGRSVPENEEEDSVSFSDMDHRKTKNDLDSFTWRNGRR